jgi:spore germination protein KC
LFKRLLISLLILCLLPTAGCWDRKEVNQTAVAIGLGLDSFQQDQILYTIQFPQTEQPGGEGMQSAFVTVSAADDTYTTAARKISLKSPRSILFQHSTVLVLGEDLGRKGLSGLVDYLARNRNIRESADVFMARDTTAADVLSVPTQVDKVPATALASMIKKQDRLAGIYTRTPVSDLTSKTAAPGMEPTVPGIAIVEREKNQKHLELSGTAVFKRGKLVGWLNEEESRGYRWLRPKMVTGGTITISCPVGGEPVLIENIRAQSQIKPEIRDGQIIMHIKVREEGFFYEQRCLHQLVTPEMLPVLNQHIEQVIKKQITLAVRQAQTLNSDIFGFGDALRKKYPGQWAELAHRWDDIFPTIKLEIEVDAKIRRVNLVSQTTRLKY